MNTAEISKKISLLRKNGKLLTNCFVNFNMSDNKEYDVFSSENALIIINHEYRVNRVWFYTSAPQDLVELCNRYLNDDEYILDIITREPKQLREELNSAGFVCISEMMRLANHKISEVFSNDSAVYNYCSCEYGQAAAAEDADVICETLWRVFDTRISHLPEKNAIMESINNGEILLHKDNNQEIVSLLQTVTAPKSLYINQVYNSAKPEVIHAMLLSVIRKYCGQGGNYIYSWVDKNNIASMKFHGKYNMQHDGLWDIVYSNKGTV